MKKFIRTLCSLVFPAAFFGIFFLYIWKAIEPTLIYHSFGRFIFYPRFSTGVSFFIERISMPGGMLEYTNGFLSQWLYYSWAGAGIITLTAMAVYICLKFLFKSETGGGFQILPYIAALGIFITYNCYDHCLKIYLSIIYSIIGAILFNKFSPSSRILRSVLFTAGSLALYYLIGAGVVLFVVIIVIEEVILRSNPFSFVVYPLITAASIWFIGVYNFGMTVEQAFVLLIPLNEEIYLNMDEYSMIAVAITYLLAAVAAGMGCWHIKNSAKNKKVDSKKKKSSKGKSANAGFFRTFRFTNAIKAVLLLILTFSAIYFTHNRIMESTIKLNYYARNKMWSELINCASDYKDLPYNGYFNHDVNRALCETTRMADKLFCFDHQLPALLMQSKLKGTPVPAVFTKRGELLLELGHVSMAERHYFEIIQSMQDCPFILEKLATIYLVKGNNEIAGIYLNRLSKNLIFRKRAKELLNQIENDPKLNNNTYIQKLRLNAVEVDTPTQEFEGEEFFMQLLDKNPKNRLAFEYMMAFNMLTGQVNKIAENIHRLDDFGCTKLPRYYQETLAIYLGSKLKKIDLGKWRPDLEALRQAKLFDNLYRYHGGSRNKAASRKALQEQFGDTYLFYFVYGIKRDEK